MYDLEKRAESKQSEYWNLTSIVETSITYSPDCMHYFPVAGSFQQYLLLATAMQAHTFNTRFSYLRHNFRFILEKSSEPFAPNDTRNTYFFTAFITIFRCVRFFLCGLYVSILTETIIHWYFHIQTPKWGSLIVSTT